ncbi:unnamed protein product, partial [Polarella glacialis]
AVFYQTDVRRPRFGQVSKAYLVMNAATRVKGVRLRWHKICHFGSIDQPSVNSLQFTHLLCFSKVIDDGAVEDEDFDLGTTIPDLVSRGQKPQWLRNSMRCQGANATAEVLKWAVRRLTGIHTVIDPFCGAGTVLAIGNEFGLHAVGVDISPKRFRQAGKLDGAGLLSGKAPTKGGPHVEEGPHAEEAEED